MTVELLNQGNQSGPRYVPVKTNTFGRKVVRSVNNILAVCVNEGSAQFGGDTSVGASDTNNVTMHNPTVTPSLHAAAEQRRHP